MGTQVVRITDEAVAIIRKYSPSDSLTRGIKEMERQLTTGNERCTTGNTNSTNSNSITVTDSYWKTFDEHLSRIELPKMGGTLKVNELKPASDSRMEYKGKTYSIKTDANGTDYIIHETKGKLQLRDKKVIE